MLLASVVCSSCPKKWSIKVHLDLSPINKVILQNVGADPIVHAFVEALLGRTIYFMGNLYYGYDHCQLGLDNQDITIIRIVIDLI